MATRKQLLDLAARLEKRAEIDRKCAENNAVIVDLLKPQMDMFEKREGHNIYAVRMAVDHENSRKKDEQYAADLEEVVQMIRAIAEGIEDVG